MRMAIVVSLGVWALVFSSCGSVWAQEGGAAATAAKAAETASPLSALARMPVREVTVFKDGHAFVMHEGRMPTDAGGDVVMDYLPTPVLGTFWPYSSDKDAKLSAVTAGQRKVLVEQTSLTLPELLVANVGAEVLVKELPTGDKEPGEAYSATIVGVPTRSGEELEKNAPPNTGPQLPQRGNLILLKTAAGVKAVAMDHIKDVIFKADHKATVGNEEFRNLLRLKLDWGGKKPAATADVGLIYLQKGIRWIPSYKVTIDGKGGAVVKLQATLINEMLDLEDATANLVVGVPSFAMKGTNDPMALQNTLAGLSQYFQEGAQTANRFSNAMMSQAQAIQSNAPGDAAEPAAPPNLGPELGDSRRSEDLFVYTVKHVTLKKGQRMVVPVAEFTLKYTDMYTLNVPFVPPQEVWRELQNTQQAELARLLGKPKALHKIRMVNDSKFPLTTAPALMVRDNTVLAQSMMLYTPVGGKTDLEVTTAVDIGAKKTDKETKRVPNAETWEGNQYARTELEGQIRLTNHKDQPVTLEVTRNVLGQVGTADNDGKASMLNILEDDDDAAAGPYPAWWGWYSWPSWSAHFNGVGQIVWNLKLEPGKSVTLNYTWSYVWH